MPAPRSPLVAIGLPVYNGANYLARALDALLAQTFEDFELIISDNASTDATEAICRQYAAQDARIRYVRSPHNEGAAANFNKVFHLARSPYFKWATHDDLYAPPFLERCVAVLDQNPSAVLAYGQTRLINEDDALIGGLYKAAPALSAPDPVARFRSILLDTVWCFEMLGLMRAEVLRQTSLLGAYYGSDRVLLAQLSLRGAFCQAPAPLIFRRCHPEQSSTGKSPRDQAAWIRGRRGGLIVFPQWHLLTGYLGALAGAPLTPAQQLRGAAAILRLATRPDKLKRLVVPGPHNYFGIGAGRRARRMAA